jgi:hypothetical protein
MKLLFIILLGFIIALELYRQLINLYWLFRFKVYWPVKFLFMSWRWKRMERNGTCDFVNKKFRHEIPESMSFEEYKKTQEAK